MLYYEGISYPILDYCENGNIQSNSF